MKPFDPHAPAGAGIITQYGDGYQQDPLSFDHLPMATHPIESTDAPPEPAALSHARMKLVEAIMAAKSEPVHESCIYAFGPFADWLCAISHGSGDAGFNLRVAAEWLVLTLAMEGHRKELKRLAQFAMNCALEDEGDK